MFEAPWQAAAAGYRLPFAASYVRIGPSNAYNKSNCIPCQKTLSLFSPTACGKCISKYYTTFPIEVIPTTHIPYTIS